MACRVDFAAEVESFALAYERAQAASCHVRVEDFLPPRDHPAYAQIGVELLRIDLELLWQQKRPRSLDEYRRQFPNILDSPARLAQLAFEDYRQRSEAGQAATPWEYAHRYGIDVSGWTEAPAASGDGNAERPSIVPELSEFEIVEELGRGAFARVFLARQTALANRPVALKVSRGVSIEPERLAQLQHENIVPIYSVHEVDGLQAVCMPYLGRSTLAQIVDHTRRMGRLPHSGHALLSTIVAANDSTTGATPTLSNTERVAVPDAPLAPSVRKHFEGANYPDAVVWIVARLASGLAHAHERGVLHRDLKPANVLFCDDGRPMILDFNLSEQLTSDSGRTAAAGGTLPYMSPEQLESLLTGAAADARSDIYSLGVIFFELLSGRLPFGPPVDASADSIAEAVSARRYGPVSVQTLNPETPASIAGAVARCLAPEPEKRYQSADQLREDLELHLENRPLAHAPDRSPRERARKWVRRHPRLSSAASIGLFSTITIAAMAAIWLVREERFGRAEAKSRFQDFTQRAEEVRLLLSVPGLDSDAHAEGETKARALLGRYKVLENGAWRRAAAYRDLDHARQQELDDEVVRTLHALAASSLKQAAAAQGSPQRRVELKEALSYNASAAESATEAMPGFSAAVHRQRRLIERARDGGHPLSPSEVIDDAAAIAGSETVAVLLLQGGRYGDALPKLAKWRDEAPNSLPAWMLLGVAHAGMGNPAEAEACFTTCTRLRPRFAFSYFQRGLARHQQREYAAAADDFSRYMQLSGVSAAALINRALAYQAIGDHAPALEDLNAALAAGARQTRIYFIRAAVRKALNDMAGARADSKRGLSLTPTDCVSWLARGIAQIGSSPELALADFRQAMRLDPGNRIAAQNILHVLSDRLNREDEALEMLEVLIAANPRDARALLTRAVLRARRNDAENAAADAMAALAIDDDPTAALQAACALAQISRADAQYRNQALQLVARALGAQPSLAAIAVTDADLAPIRDSEAFERILNAADVIRNSGLTVKQEATAAR